MTCGSTIFALSSGAGRAGVAVMRVSGPGAGRAVETLAGGLPKPRFASFRRLRDARGEPIDDALVLWFPGPRSETGEDMAEFQVHGSRAVVVALSRELAAMDGFRLAEPGEFLRRAFTNGKIDLTGVEGIGDLIDAETEVQRRQALGQASGGLVRLYDGWRDRLLQAMALVEGAIDFSDEADVAETAAGDAGRMVHGLAQDIRQHLAGANRGEIIRDGFRVVFAGRPNVGKSSLLNALARRDVAIVSEEAGTTRDVIEVRLDLAGLPISISDTAGLRECAGTVEREGIRRTLERSREANLVVWVIDATEPVVAVPPELESASTGRLVAILNKCDAPGSAASAGLADIRLSARTGQGLDDLIQLIAGRAQAAAGESTSDPVPTNERQRLLLAEALGHLETFRSNAGRPIELAAEDLRLAAAALGRITGLIDPEDVLGAIFSRFCIGK